MKMLTTELGTAVQAVIDGEACPLEVYGEIIRIERYLSECKEIIFPAALSESEKHGKNFEYKGMEVRVSEGRKVFSFSHIKAHNDLKTKLKEVEEAAKRAAEAMDRKLTFSDEQGEVIEPAQVSFTKPSLTIKFKNK